MFVMEGRLPIAKEGMKFDDEVFFILSKDTTFDIRSQIV
jgi:hypothetical protein